MCVLYLLWGVFFDMGNVQDSVSEGDVFAQVNHKEVISPLQQLEQCDRVEVFESGWAEANPLQPGVREVEHSRQLLQRIFTRSGSLSGDFGTDFGGFSLQRGTPVGQG